MGALNGEGVADAVPVLDRGEERRELQLREAQEAMREDDGVFWCFCRHRSVLRGWGEGSPR